MTCGANRSARTPGQSPRPTRTQRSTPRRTGHERQVRLELDLDGGVRRAEARQTPDEPARGQNGRDRHHEPVAGRFARSRHCGREVGEATLQEAQRLDALRVGTMPEGRPLEQGEAEDALGLDDLLAHAPGVTPMSAAAGLAASPAAPPPPARAALKRQAVERVGHAARLYPIDPIVQCGMEAPA
jgi:hypothetical protein